jgi:hypothetical protein
MDAMGQDPNMNYFTKTADPVPKNGQLKQFTDKKHELYHWSDLSKFLRQEGKVKKENRTGRRPAGIVNAFQGQMATLQ